MLGLPQGRGLSLYLQDPKDHWKTISCARRAELLITAGVKTGWSSEHLSGKEWRELPGAIKLNLGKVLEKSVRVVIE